MKETKKARREVEVRAEEEAEARQIADQEGQDSCTVGQEMEVKWVQDYVTDSTGWMADGLAELKAAEAVLKEWTQSQEKRQQMRSQRIYWETESRNGVKFLKHGARNKVVQE